MANVAHGSLTDPNLHECKGAPAAAVDTFPVANGSGSTVWKKRLFKATAAITPALVAANTTAEQTFAVAGIAVATDSCIGVSKPAAQAGLGIVGWRVSADNTIAITFSNNTAAGITPTAAETYTFIIYRT